MTSYVANEEKTGTRISNGSASITMSSGTEIYYLNARGGTKAFVPFSFAAQKSGSEIGNAMLNGVGSVESAESGKEASPFHYK